MRLIDADELKKILSEEITRRFVRWDKTITVTEWETFTRDVIDNAPTVEAVEFEYHSKLLKQAYQKGKNIRPQGEWIRTAIYGQTCYECNQCQIHQEYTTKFCPNCGARMGGNDNE